LTKVHEELFIGTVSQALGHFEDVRGELTIVLDLKNSEDNNGEKDADY